MATPPPPKDTRFKPGQSGNPRGRPPIKKVRAAIRKFKPNAISALGLALEPENIDQWKWAVPLWFAYFYGKPVDQVALLDKHGEAQTLSNLTDEQLEAKWRALQEKIEAEKSRGATE